MNRELFEIFRISIKATHQEGLHFNMFHCFNISKQISISVLFFIISVSCFVVFFAAFLKIIVPRVRVLARFICPRGRGFALFCAVGGGGGGGGEGMVSLGID